MASICDQQIRILYTYTPHIVCAYRMVSHALSQLSSLGMLHLFYLGFWGLTSFAVSRSVYGSRPIRNPIGSE